MTITLNNSFPIEYAGNGSAVTFSYPWKISAASDLLVAFIVAGVYTLQPSSAYTVAGVGNNGGGSITFTTAPPLGTTVDLRPDTPETQTTEFANLAAYLPENSTNTADRIVRMLQDLTRLTYTFGIHGPDQEFTAWPALPNAASRAGTLLGFDGTTGLPSLTVPLSTFLTQTQFNTLLNTPATPGNAIANAMLEAASPSVLEMISNPETLAENNASEAPQEYAFSASLGIDVRRYMSSAQLADFNNVNFNNGTPTVDQSSALIAAFAVAAATTNWGTVLIPGMLYLTKTVDIDRQVQTHTQPFIVKGIGPGAGFYVASAITMFDSSLTASGAPVSELVTFRDIRFASANQAYSGSYATCFSSKFLRMRFESCVFFQINVLTATYYAQSWKFTNCWIKAHPYHAVPAAAFFYAPGLYDVLFFNCEVGNYPAGLNAGTLIKVDNADSSGRGCNALRIIGCDIEGLAGGTVALTGCSGFAMIGNHIENNAAVDVNLFAGNLTNDSVGFYNNYVYNPNGAWISHGPAVNVTSKGNTVTKAGSGSTDAGMIHSDAVQVQNLFSEADYADGGLSDGAWAYNFGALYMQVPVVGTSPAGAVRLINRRIPLTYSASISVNATLANFFDVTATDNTAFTINFPTNLVDGQHIYFRIANNAGAALGALTWASGYQLAGSWTQPASGNNRTIEFEYNGTKLYEVARAAADVTS